VGETLRQPMQGADWISYLELLQWVREQPPVFQPAELEQEYRAQLADFGMGELIDDVLAGSDLFSNTRSHLDEFSKLAGPLPLALVAWYEHIGAVNLYGYHPRWDGYIEVPQSLQDHYASEPQAIGRYQKRYLMSHCDPLQVCALDEARMTQLRETRQRQPLQQFEFASDCYFKDYTAGSSSPYTIQLVDPGMDGVMPGRPYQSFIQYLRQCFRWGGFPGWEEQRTVRPDEDLAYLTADLLPI
jgi:hypothetical protein